MLGEGRDLCYACPTARNGPNEKERKMDMVVTQNRATGKWHWMAQGSGRIVGKGFENKFDLLREEFDRLEAEDDNATLDRREQIAAEITREGAST